jgi:hypothetical protein
MMYNQSSETVVVADPPVTSESILAFGVVWSIFEESIRRFACIITPDDDDQEDPIQEAMITLWKCEPTRWGFENGQAGQSGNRLPADLMGEPGRDPGGQAELVGLRVGPPMPRGGG